MADADRAALAAEILALSPELAPLIPDLADRTEHALRELLAELQQAQAMYAAAGLVDESRAGA